MRPGAAPVDLGFLAQLPGDALESLTLRPPLLGRTIGVIAHLAPGLRRLYLGATELTDDALPAVAALRGLTYLQAWGNHFTDGAVQQLAALSDLEQLYLEEKTLTVAALDFVGRLPNLTRLGLQDMPISDEDLASLQARLPAVRVSR